MLVFCHEYLSDRWSFQPYADAPPRPGLRPLHVRLPQPRRQRLRPALSAAAVGDRPRGLRPPRGAGLPAVPARPRPGRRRPLRRQPRRRDGADRRGGRPRRLGGGHRRRVPDPGHHAGLHPPLGRDLRGQPDYLWKHMPIWVFRFVGWMGRLRSKRRLNCRFPDVEHAVARLAPRPWLMIHGAKDAYIGPEIAERLFAEARRSQGTLDRPRGQAQPLPRGRSRTPTPSGSPPSSVALPRVACSRQPT